MARVLMLAIGLFTAGVSGCSEAGPMEIHAHDGPAIRVSGLEGNYGWLESPGASTQNPGIHEVVIETIDDELAKRGFAKSAGAGAGFLVEYVLFKENKTDSSVNPHGVVYPRGTMIIRLLDPGSRQLIWGASATANILTNAPPEERRQRVHEAVHKMLSKMPPRKA